MRKYFKGIHLWLNVEEPTQDITDNIFFMQRKSLETILIFYSFMRSKNVFHPWKWQNVSYYQLKLVKNYWAFKVTFDYKDNQKQSELHM